MISIKVTPMGAPRMNRSDAWRKRPVVLRYRIFRDKVNEAIKNVEGIDLMDTLNATFYVPMPKSWSEKKREKMEFTWHQQKPDIDNMVKALLDAIFRGGDDCKVAVIHAKKCWSQNGDKVGRVDIEL